MKIECELNGKALCLDVPGDRRVVDCLREDLGLTGTKEGCGTGECGACTILVDGRSRLSCLTLAAQLQDRTVVTIEGLAEGASLHPVQAAFVAHGAVQCGFCTPGMVLTAVDLLQRQPHPDRQEITRAVSGNLCRCTGYGKIVAAIHDAPASDPSPRPVIDSAPAVPAAVVSPAKQRFPVFFPESFAELWTLFAAHPDARVVAGGTDILVWLRNGRISPGALIFMERLAGIRGISMEQDGIRIGAGTTHEELLESTVIKRNVPILSQALATLGSPHIRRLGTLGGNIMTASPAGDSLPPLVVLGAEVELQSGRGMRRLPLARFLLGPGRTALSAGEILSAVILPVPASGGLQHFEKVGLRAAMACAVASLAAVIRLDPAGNIEAARLAWGSVGPTVVQLPEVEEALRGKPFTRVTLERAVPLVGPRLAPISDVRASADYRRTVAGNLLLRLAAVVDANTGCDREDAA